MNWKKATFLIALSLILCSVVAAQVERPKTKTSPSSSSVWLGATVVNIPSPQGYEEAMSQFEAVKMQMMATELPVAHLLFAHLPEADCQVLRSGQTTRFIRYTTVSVRKEPPEAMEFSTTDMQEVIAEFRKQGSSILDPEGPAMKAVFEAVEKQFGKLTPTDKPQFDLNKTQNLGEFDVRPEVYSVMFFMTLTKEAGGTATTFPVLSTLTYLKLKNRLVYVCTHLVLSSPEAAKTELKPGVAELKQLATKWVNELLAANRDAQ